MRTATLLLSLLSSFVHHSSMTESKADGLSICSLLFSWHLMERISLDLHLPGDLSISKPQRRLLSKGALEAEPCRCSAGWSCTAQRLRGQMADVRRAGGISLTELAGSIAVISGQARGQHHECCSELFCHVCIPLLRRSHSLLLAKSPRYHQSKPFLTVQITFLGILYYSFNSYLTINIIYDY